MRRVSRIALVLTLLALAMASGAKAVPICPLISEYCGPILRATFSAHVSPVKLPVREYTPVTWRLFGKIGTSNGGHPPALREFEVDVDKDVRLNARGYPVCRVSKSTRPSPGTMMEACRTAVLGKGKAHVEIAFPEEEPILIKSPLTVFNGGEKGGKVKLLIQISIAVPVPTAVVTEITITRKGTGVHTVSKLPAIAGGSGSLTDFDFKLGKTFTFKNEEIGYFEAKCPDEVFKINVKKILFKNEAQTPGEGASKSLKGSLAVPCTATR